MSDKRIKNEQWSVKQLISKIDNKDIIKPKFQRKKKWDTLPKKDTPNDKAYIEFLYDTENSVHAITFGQESNQKGIIYSNIDGNNRINAIKHFMDQPFEIFSEHLDDLKRYIDTICLTIDEKELLKKIFESMSYNEIIKFRYNKYFIEKGYKELYNLKIKIYRDEFEGFIDQIQEKLKVNSSDSFDENVKINVNLFEGYNTDELCKTFEDINKYNSKLTETELLACRLHNICSFIISNKPFESELNECIKEYYEDKSNLEVLDCYKFDGTINAHDFIVGFQNLCNKRYNFIGKTDVDGLSLFFKLWKAINNSFDYTFTTENVNDFIEKINYSCEILKETISNIFTDKINNSLFNKSCQDKLKILKKKNLFILISSIIGYKNKNEKKEIIIKSLEKCLLYHFFVSDIKEKDTREDYHTNDPIINLRGGAQTDKTGEMLLKSPDNISTKLDKDLFIRLTKQLMKETNSPYERKQENGNPRNEKRRKLKFFEKTLMFYYYKGKIPTNMLNNEFSIEHIIPNSSDWEGEIDKDRTGNMIPIIASLNCGRGNKHINYYNNTEKGQHFYEFIKDIIPDNDCYNNIINHESNKKPIIISNEKYNEMCEENEAIYLKNFIGCLFK